MSKGDACRVTVLLLAAAALLLVVGCGTTIYREDFQGYSHGGNPTGVPPVGNATDADPNVGVVYWPGSRQDKAAQLYPVQPLGGPLIGKPVKGPLAGSYSCLLEAHCNRMNEAPFFLRLRTGPFNSDVLAVVRLVEGTVSVRDGNAFRDLGSVSYEQGDVLILSVKLDLSGNTYDVLIRNTTTSEKGHLTGVSLVSNNYNTSNRPRVDLRFGLNGASHPDIFDVDDILITEN